MKSGLDATPFFLLDDLFTSFFHYDEFIRYRCWKKFVKWRKFRNECCNFTEKKPDDSLFGQDEAIAEPQQFVVLELKNSGQDLEGVTLTNASQGWAVFQQVAHALAMAEKLLAFEHRDLHWGNVLIQTCTEKHILFGHASETFKVETQGVRATIIDFSLSRLSLPTDTGFKWLKPAKK